MIRSSGSATLSGSGALPATTLAEWLRDVPEGAQLRITTDRGDRPGESSTWTVVATWDTGRPGG